MALAGVAAGCGGFGPGASDFSAPLSNGYELVRTSAHQVIVVPSDGWNESTPIIPAKVMELDHDATWVIAKQQQLRRRSPNNPNDTYEEPDPGVFSYWILNTRTPQAWGPLDQQQFQEMREQKGVDPALRLHDVTDYRT